MTKVAELEKQLLEAKKEEEVASVQKTIDFYNNQYKGKVFSRFIKSSRRELIFITYFHDFFLYYDYDKTPKIASSQENIEIIKNQWGVNKQIIYKDCRKSKEAEHIYHELRMNEWGDQIQEISIDEFNRLKKTCSGLVDSLANDFFSDKEIKYNCDITGGEYDYVRADEETYKEIDIPHIILKDRESFLIGKSVFLRSDCYILTPNSKKLAISRLEKKIKDEQFNIGLAYEYGYRYRDDIEQCQELINKFKKL